MRGYPEYKDSGVEWLGEIPSHWDSIIIKRKYEVTLGKMLCNEPRTPRDSHEIYLKAGSIQPYGVNTKDLPKMWFSPKEKNKLLLIFGDLVISEGGDAGRCAIWKNEVSPCYIQNAVNRVRGPSLVSTKYLYYWVQLIKSNGFIDIVCNKSTIAHYTAEKVEATECLSPSEEEKKCIVNYLDRETARIDKLITEKQNFIKLLKEKRQALISHVVTKGLDPDVKMKDSGIEWIGEVPEHWAISKLSYRYEVLLGKMLDDKKITGKHLGRYLRNTDVQWDKINDGDLPQMDFKPNEVDRYQVRKGDLLVCEGGEIGRCAIWKKEKSCFYQKALHRLRPYSNKKDHTRFLFYVISDAVNQERFISRANKATIAHLPAETFRQYRFAFPSFEEQKEIADYLDCAKNKYDSLLDEVNVSIEYLKEHRTALISAAVTGKIDVRDQARESAA